MIHLAALPSAPRSIEHPLTTNAVNATGTQMVGVASSSSSKCLLDACSMVR